METFYLVDYENVGSTGVLKCDGLEKTDHLHIFYTENAKKIDLDIVADHGDAEFVIHKVPIKSQSVDMHIVSFMGYLIGKNSGEKIKVVIISKDTDFDNLIKFWNEEAELSRKPKMDISKKKARAAKAPAKPKDSSAPIDSELKTRLNAEIQKTLSQGGFDNRTINNVAKLVGKHYGKGELKRDVHNALMKSYKKHDEIYKAIKVVLSKYS
ncbi:MAG: hypothetical protein IK152_03140 [Lachnospiraceae bacterium]|nr:hypothetical protein [Lachnospiraceae bacterium]